MPAPLAVDRESVKAHAITYGVREAARAYGISEETVKAWSRRDGWLVGAGEAVVVRPLPASMVRQAAPDAPTASQAAETSMARLGERSKSRLARGLARGALHIAHMKPATVVANAQQIKALADTGAKLHGWGPEQSGPVIRLELLAQAAAGPVYDVAAEVQSGPVPE